MSGSERVDVLAVDDNPANLLSLETVLRDLGANLVKAHSGDEALLRVLERDFALVLLDIQMPGLDGFETARLIRSRDRCRHLPVIFLTAYDRDAEQVQRGYGLGAVDFLFKPIVPAVLKSKVSVFLDLHRKTAEVLRQAALLQEASRRDHERRLAEARARWERERLRVSNERLQTLANVGSLLLSERDPQVFFAAVCQELSERTGLELGSAYLAAGAEGNFSLVWQRGLGGRAPVQVSAWSRSAIDRRAPVVLQRLQSSSEPLGESARALGVRAGVTLPLIADRRVLGVVGFGTCRRDTLTDDELAVLQVGADQLAIALDRVELERQLRRSAAELKEGARRKDEFLAMLAHELRNPLAPIVNAIHLVNRTTPQPAPVQRAIAAAERQAHHMARLVDDLLDVSRITQGKIALRKERVQLAQMIDLALQTTGPLIEKKRQHLSVEVPDAPVALLADATRLAQVVANLLHNASKYTDPGGRLQLRAEVVEGALVIAVEDDGVGIAPEQLERIFETFVQIDPTSDRARGGLGIGLTLVRTIVSLHGGTVAAQSEGSGKGARFTVRLPVVVEDAAPAVRAPQENEMAAASRSILLVEDNDDIRLTLRDLLEFEGHEVDEAADGAAGANLIVEKLPNVALVDIGLPGLDGYGVARHVRERRPDAKTRLVALTGYGGDDVARKVREAGFDAHLVKPVKLDELFRILGDLA